MTEKLDVYSRVTDKIIADIEARKSHMVAAVAGRRTQGGSDHKTATRRRHSLSWRQCSDALGVPPWRRATTARYG